jgi:hypothetical protein
VADDKELLAADVVFVATPPAALDDVAAARSTVIALAKEIGFEGVDAGHLDASPNIENLGLLVGQLAYGSGFGNRVTLRAYVAPRPVRRARPGKGSTVPKRRRNP